MKTGTFGRLFSSVAILAFFVVAGSILAAPGDLYVTETLGTTVSKFAPDGSKTTFADGLNRPQGLAFDRMGNLFVAEGGTVSILKFAPDGTKSTFASDLRDPIGLAI
ncbi:MAG: hypothetical protein M3429_06890, partial [Verrucomicrobiota bacterium]|nr:hypothetical protein [Verrucomicrobiota bacterium]